MPNRTIYVSDADLPLFERAQQLGGNLSATIAQALRRYMEAQERKSAGFEEVRVKVGKIAYVQKRFMGRLLAKGRVANIRWRSFRRWRSCKGASQRSCIRRRRKR